MSNSGRFLLSLILLAFLLKTLVLIADPIPQFFLGDSASYIATALSGWIPPDRSYVYGFFIRWISVGTGSLFSLVLAQTAASAISAGLLGWNLRRFLEIPPTLAALVTAAYSFDPLQLMYERFVMAEAFSLLAAMAFLSLMLLFVDTGKKHYLVLASIAGVISVALRISFLPPVAALTFSAPLIRFFMQENPLSDLRARIKSCLLAFVVAAISYLSVQTGYKVLTGFLSHEPPAYQYADGFSLLSSWAPALKSQDLKAAGASTHIFDHALPNNLETRRAQRWMKNGLVAILNQTYPDSLKANAIAKKIAFHILQRDPVGVAMLAEETYFRGWRSNVIAACIREDTGIREIPAPFAADLSQYFHLSVNDLPSRPTVTKVYFSHGSYWYRVLLLTPCLVALTVPLTDPRHRATLLCVAIFAVIVLLIAVGLAVDNSIRYLHPLSWTFFVFAAYWLNRVLRKKPANVTTAKAPPFVSLLVISLLGPLFLSTAMADNAGDRPGLYVSNGVLTRQGKPYLGIGANYNTLFGQLLLNKDSTTSLEKLARLGRAGIPFVRFRASGFGPENQQLYLTNRADFFRRMDQVVRCAEKNNIGLIPSLFWRLATVSEVVGESRERLGDPNGKASAYIRQFTRDMVERYKDSPAIWGWEFGNEANLGVDLPNARTGEHLSSEQLRAVYSIFARTVREIDPTRIIEPGTSLPRPFAWQMAHGRRGRPDNTEESFATLRTLTPDPMNMTSVHVYERAKTAFGGERSIDNILAALTRSAAAAGKPLFLGEFPTQNRAETAEFLQAIANNRVPLSAFWVFDQPSQKGTMSVDFDGPRAFVIDLVGQANKELQARP
ncbi:MAG: cellulase family glycosylhydrolase [Chthoniobacterales bacterium]